MFLHLIDLEVSHLLFSNDAQLCVNTLLLGKILFHLEVCKTKLKTPLLSPIHSPPLNSCWDTG